MGQSITSSTPCAPGAHAKFHRLGTTAILPPIPSSSTLLQSANIPSLHTYASTPPRVACPAARLQRGALPRLSPPAPFAAPPTARDPAPRVSVRPRLPGPIALAPARSFRLAASSTQGGWQCEKARL